MRTGTTRVFLFAWIFAATLQAATLHWHRVTHFEPGTRTFNGVRFGGGTFVALDDDTLVYTSDGITWRQAHHFAPAEGFVPMGDGRVPPGGGFRSIAYGNGRFV